MDGGAPGDATIEFRIEPGNDRYRPADSRWQAQVTDLRVDLNKQVGGLVRTANPTAPGDKGAVVPLIIALGSSGAFATFYNCMRAWLQRDRTRYLEIIWDVDGEERRVVLRGDAIDAAAVRAVAEAAAQRIGPVPPL